MLIGISILRKFGKDHERQGNFIEVAIIPYFMAKTHWTLLSVRHSVPSPREREVNETWLGSSGSSQANRSVWWGWEPCADGSDPGLGEVTWIKAKTWIWDKRRLFTFRKFQRALHGQNIFCIWSVRRDMKKDMGQWSLEPESWHALGCILERSFQRLLELITC